MRVTTQSTKLRPKNVLRTSAKNTLTSWHEGTFRNTSVSGRQLSQCIIIGSQIIIIRNPRGLSVCKKKILLEEHYIVVPVRRNVPIVLFIKIVSICSKYTTIYGNERYTAKCQTYPCSSVIRKVDALAVRKS